MLRCKICHHWQCDEKDVVKPTVKEWKRFISSMRGEVHPDFRIVFGGGEPLLFPEDLLELISFSSGLGFGTALSTSGHTITKDYARRLVESGLNNIDLTIFSLDKHIHDDIRGTEGSLERVLGAIDYLGSFSDSPKIGINTIIMKPSLDGLADLTEWVNSNKCLTGIYYQAITRPFHTPFVKEWHNKDEYSFLWPNDTARLDAVIDSIIDMKKRSRRFPRKGTSKIRVPTLMARMKSNRPSST